MSDKPTETKWQDERIKFINQRVFDGWNYLGDSTDGKIAYFERDNPVYAIGDDSSRPILTGLTLTFTNRMASLSIAGQQYPIKQYTGGVSRTLSMQVAGPGGWENSGVGVLVDYLSNEQQMTLQDRSYARNSRLRLVHNLANAFDIDFISLQTWQAGKHSVDTSSAAITLQTQNPRKKRVWFSGRTKALSDAKIKIYKTLLGKFDGTATKVSGVLDGIKTWDPSKQSQLETYAMSFSVSDNFYNSMQVETDIIKDLQKLLDNIVRSGLVNKGIYSDMFIAKFKLQPLVQEPYTKPVTQAEIQALAEAYHKKAEDALLEYGRALAQGSQQEAAEALSRSRQYSSSAEQTTSRLGSASGAIANNLAAVGSSALANLASWMNQKLDDFLTPERMSLLLSSGGKEYNWIADLNPGFTLTGLPAYGDVLLPVCQIGQQLTTDRGYNPDFWWGNSEGEMFKAFNSTMDEEKSKKLKYLDFNIREIYRYAKAGDIKDSE